MASAVDDIEHRYRQCHSVASAEVSVKRNTQTLRRGSCHSHRNTQYCIGTEVFIVVAAIELFHDSIDFCLVIGTDTNEFVGDFGIDVFTRFQYAFAHISVITVSQLKCFPFTGTCT